MQEFKFDLHAENKNKVQLCPNCIPNPNNLIKVERSSSHRLFH